VLGKTSLEKSSWFSGYDEAYYYSKGAYYRMAHPQARWLWMLYCAFRIGDKSKISKRKALYWMQNGSRGYEAGLSFAEWKDAPK